MKTEILKSIPMSAENNRSGKNWLKYRGIVAAGDYQGKIGIGSCTNRSKEIAQKRAEEMARQNMFEILMASHPSTPGSNHTLAQMQTGSYKDLEITLSPAPRGTGLKAWMFNRNFS